MDEPKLAGFSLIELLIAITILGIITVIAVNLYSPYVRKGRRIDAIDTLLAISLAQERFRSTNATYGTLAQVWGGVTTTPEGYYNLAISNNTATSYTVTATGTGTQANDTASGTSCQTLTITASNGTVTRTPAACWPK